MSFQSALEKLEAHRGGAGKQLALERLNCLFDTGSMSELDAFTKNGERPAEVVTAYGTVDGCPVYAFCQNSEIFSGAMGKAQAAKILRVFELAEKTGVPVVGLYDSGGVHLREGMDALDAYGMLIHASNTLSGVVPQISVVLGVCAGSAAVLATSADLMIVSGESELFLQAPFVLRDESGKIGDPELVCANGIAQIYQKEEQAAIQKARELIMMLPQNNLSVPVLAEQAGAAADSAAFNTQKPAVDMLLDVLVDAGSRFSLSTAYAPGAWTVLARIEGAVCGIVATDSAVDDGRLTADGCVKIARFVRMCDAFSIPLVTFVDSQGFALSATSEIAGNVRDAALLAHAYAEATTVKIAVITGNVFGPVYTLLAGRGAASDAVYAWPQAVISPLHPDAAATILLENRLKAGEPLDALREEYIEKEASAFVAAGKGYIDDVIEPAQTRGKIYTALDMLSGKRVSTLSKKHSNMPF